ncbi:MAG: 3-dehydroquinate synthase [Nanoarchaeota archaeon]|nr:3-dehydroquinate synthase [Nanoarchaeota archaeon]
MNNSYGILIDKNLLSRIPLALKRKNLGNRYLIITDSNVKRLFGDKLLRLMKKKGLKADILSFKAGEQNKNLNTFSNLIEKTYKLGLDRKSAIIALGGGVVGDIAGFVAASYMRGINYIQIPTSLLAMVDSSIGGKVAVDLKLGKNMVGNFYQPKQVYIDVSLLKTLPKKEVINGMAEIIKHALIKDLTLFNYTKKNLSKIMSKDEKTLIRIIKRSCQIKAEVVGKDEKESGLRKILNYGHTIGHAIEQLTGYKKYSHGEAILVGMMVEGLVSNKIGMLSKKDLLKQNKLIKEITSIKLPNINTSKIINELKKDKKAIWGRIEFVLLEKIGKVRHSVKVPNDMINYAIQKSK